MLAIPLLPPWYVDLDRGVMGPLDVPGNQEIIARLFAMPPLGDLQAVVVAEQDGRLAGVGMAAAPSQPEFGARGEICSLYLDPGFQRRGLGRRLMLALAEQVGAWGYRGAALGVVVGNEPAIAYYETLGGRVAGKYIDPGPLWRSDNLIFVWDEVSDLIGAASR